MPRRVEISVQHRIQILRNDLPASAQVGLARLRGAVVGDVEIDPHQDALAFSGGEVDAFFAFVVRVSVDHEIGQRADRRAPGFRCDLQDVRFAAVEGGDPRRVRIAAESRHAAAGVAAMFRLGAAPREILIGDVEVIGAVAAEVGLRFAVVAAHAMFVEHRLDHAGEAESIAASPLGFLQLLAPGARRRSTFRR